MAAFCLWRLTWRHFERTQGRRDEHERFFLPKVTKRHTAHTAHPTRTFDPFAAGHESRVSPLDITPLKS